MSNEAQRFRKKPVEVEAMQVLDDMGNHLIVAGWVDRNGGKAGIPAIDPWLLIETLHGRVRAEIGDWIVRGPSGDFWPVKPDIFAETYEPVVAQRLGGVS